MKAKPQKRRRLNECTPNNTIVMWMPNHRSDLQLKRPEERSLKVTMPCTKSWPVPTFPITDEPQPLPVLSSQIELFYQPIARVSVSASEELIGPKPKTHLTAFTKVISQASTPMVSSRATTPQAARVGKKSVIIESPIESEEDHSLSPSSASESSLSSLTSEVPIARKIPKPSGEASQPGREGYNLQDQLGWSNEEFKTMKVSHQ